MKTIKLTLALIFIQVFYGNVFSQTDILNFNCTGHIDISVGTSVVQTFTMPAGADYYITEMGMQINASSPDGKVYLGIYEHKDSGPYGAGEYLVYRTPEIVYTGGTDKTVSVQVAPGTQKLEAGKTYLATLIYSGADYLSLKSQTGATNNGIATGLTNAKFKTGVTYPHFPNPFSSSSSWAFNLGIVVKGVSVTTPIAPKDEILDFNCTDYQELATGTLIFNTITVPQLQEPEVRHIGIKTDASTVNGAVKFAIYDNSATGHNLLYVSEELTISGAGIDTSYVTVPASALVLTAGSSYNLAMQYQGSGYMHYLVAVNPDSKGIVSIYANTYYKTGQTYPDFPDPVSSQSTYASTTGFVLNGDGPNATAIDADAIKKHEIRVFPTLAENVIWLYSENDMGYGTEIVIYNIIGQKVKKVDWGNSNRTKIDISGLCPGNYLINICNKKGVFQTIKFIKKP